MSEKATSIKQLIQQMIPESIGLIEGVVVKAAPLSVQVVNNPKMVVSGAMLIIPRHLTDYTTKMSTDNPDIKIDVTIYNSLKQGEKVHMLRFYGGKFYYVLDRVVS